MCSRQRNERRRQERMDIVVVDDLPGFDHAESRFCLRRSPPPGICSPDRNGIGAVVPGERITLCRSDANVPVKRMIDSFLRRQPLRDRTLARSRLHLADSIRPAPGKQGQQQRQYQRQQFHQRKNTQFPSAGQAEATLKSMRSLISAIEIYCHAGTHL